MIEYIALTGSTNADLAARLRTAEPVPEGHWLVANRQTSGRGRMGREWLDGHGNFMGSTLVYPRFGDPAPGTLALLAGLALHEILLPLAPDVRLKWPNDLMLGQAKLAGILLEREGDAVIVGIGVNLVSAPSLPDRKTIALADLTEAPARDQFAEALAAQFAVELERWRSYGLASMINRWLVAGHPVGTALSVDGLKGSFAGLTDEGLLQLRLADGTTRIINAGEVSLN